MCLKIYCNFDRVFMAAISDLLHLIVMEGLSQGRDSPWLRIRCFPSMVVRIWKVRSWWKWKILSICLWVPFSNSLIRGNDKATKNNCKINISNNITDINIKIMITSIWTVLWVYLPHKSRSAKSADRCMQTSISV